MLACFWMWVSRIGLLGIAAADGLGVLSGGGWVVVRSKETWKGEAVNITHIKRSNEERE